VRDVFEQYSYIGFNSFNFNDSKCDVKLVSTIKTDAKTKLISKSYVDIKGSKSIEGDIFEWTWD